MSDRDIYGLYWDGEGNWYKPLAIGTDEAIKSEPFKAVIQGMEEEPEQPNVETVWYMDKYCCICNNPMKWIHQGGGIFYLEDDAFRIEKTDFYLCPTCNKEVVKD